MTPDEPESPGPPDAADEHAKSRADLQAELRKSRKKERKRQHRWRRRTLYALSFIVLLAALGVGGLYFYANYRFDQIKKIHAKHLVAAARSPASPSTSCWSARTRAPSSRNSTQVKAFGDEANAGGQRSDVTMVARFDPAAKTVTVLSIPRDLWVDIPGNDSGISGMNRINAAYDSGPDLLIQTIEQDLGIPINHYVAVNFPGFSGMVNALGGVTMDFPTAVKDPYTGLDVTTTGCQVVNGTTALQLVRSRHLYYMNSNGYWEYDGLSDFSRIQRQDAFFRAVLAKVNASITNPLAINSFIGAAVGNLTIDDTLSQGDLFHIAEDFRGLPSSHLVTETLPTTAYVTAGGADVLQEAQPYAQNMIDAFNAIGRRRHVPVKGAKSDQHHHHDDGPHRGPQPGRRQRVQRVDRGRHRAPHGIGAHRPGLRRDRRSAMPRRIARRQPFGDPLRPLRVEAAQTLASALGGPVTLVPDASLSGQTVSLLIAGSQLTVTGSSGTTTTTTTTPTGPTTTTTTTIPSDVYTNTQPEPWNPFPCTLGQPTPATPTTARRRPSRRSSRSGRLAALPHDPPALPLGRAAPDALTLAVGQGVLEARLADRAYGANSLGLGRVGLVLCDRVERLDVEAPAGGLLAPRGGDHGKHFLITDKSADT